MTISQVVGRALDILKTPKGDAHQLIVGVYTYSCLRLMFFTTDIEGLALMYLQLPACSPT